MMEDFLIEILIEEDYFEPYYERLYDYQFNADCVICYTEYKSGDNRNTAIISMESIIKHLLKKIKIADRE